MGDTTSLMLSMLFGAIGAGYFIYGKKQGHPVALIAGVLLCVYPWFVGNVYLMLGVGIALTAAPFVVRR